MERASVTLRSASADQEPPCAQMPVAGAQAQPLARQDFQDVPPGGQVEDRPGGTRNAPQFLLC